MRLFPPFLALLGLLYLSRAIGEWVLEEGYPYLAPLFPLTATAVAVRLFLRLGGAS